MGADILGLLAGAPRANDSLLPDVVQPGAVFQCNWQYRSSCQPVFIDDVGNEKQVMSKWKNITVRHRKDNQWLGASMDINVNGDRRVMVCAPRWIDTKFQVQDILLMNGMCYEATRELQFNELSPWPALEYWKKQIHNDGYFVYGLGSLGMSAAYSKDGSFAVLGAPGLNDWAGGFAYVEEDPTSKPKVQLLEREEFQNSKFGMAVTTAKLTYEGLVTIVGGPTADGHGKIIAFDKRFKVVLTKEGDQLGSSFGSSVCAIDLNNDGLDELVVGAPNYMDNMDEGRVYVFMNHEFYKLELVETLLSGSNAPGARFGTAVANVGDLNLDNYEDLAVGAPYEEGSGVLYIYNGNGTGLHLEPAQRIVGKLLNNDLKTFGWAISRPWDVDNNHHKDIAIGAFQSDRVVLLRTRTVLDLLATLKVTPKVVDLNKEPSCMYHGQPIHCLEAEICLHYRGRNIPPSSDVNITFNLDTFERHRKERSRLFTAVHGGHQVETINEILTLRLERETCMKKYTIYVRKCRDVVTPMYLQLDFDIASSSIGIASSCNICPIRNKYNNRTIEEKVVFATDCGSGSKCKPELSLEAKPVFDGSRMAFVVDSSPSFSLNITVHNTGQTSYLTIVSILHPSSIYFSSSRVHLGWASVKCSRDLSHTNSSHAGLLCDLMAPVKTKQKAQFTVTFFSEAMPYDAGSLPMSVEVKSLGSDQLPSHTDLTIPVVMETQLDITAVSLPLMMPMSYGSLDELGNRVPFSHVYILRNQGPSPLPHGQLTVSLPPLDWLRIDNVQSEASSLVDPYSHVPVVCSVAFQHSKQDHRNMWNIGTGHTMTSVSCATQKCTFVKCNISYMHRLERVHIHIKMSVPADLLNKIKELEVERFRVISYGNFDGPMSYHSLTVDQNVTTGSVFMPKSQPGRVITWWLLIISVSSGLLLLYLLAILLWKVGFFKRTKKLELESLMRSTESERELLHSDSASTGTGDVMVLPAYSMNSDRSLLHYPSEMDEATWEQAFQQTDFFYNQSLNRRDLQRSLPEAAHWHNTLRSSNRAQLRNGNQGPRSNVWVAPPAAPVPPPSFNNEVYLEPLESRA